MMELLKQFQKKRINFLKILFLFLFIFFYSTQKSFAEDINSVLNQLDILQKDIKTLEKAVYSQDVES